VAAHKWPILAQQRCREKPSRFFESIHGRAVGEDMETRCESWHKIRPSY